MSPPNFLLPLSKTTQALPPESRPSMVISHRAINCSLLDLGKRWLCLYGLFEYIFLKVKLNDVVEDCVL